MTEGRLYGKDADQVVVDEIADMQTTVFDLTETTRTIHGEEVRGWECRECGQSCEEMYGSYEYCPHCRRKVDRCEGRDMEKKKKTAMVEGVPASFADKEMTRLSACLSHDHAGE